MAAVLLALFGTDLMETAGTRQLQSDQLLMNWKHAHGFLIYLLLCRGLPFYLLVLLTLRTGKHFFLNLYFLYGGFIYGIQAVLMAVLYGITGIPIMFFLLMPQLLFYFMALYLGCGRLSDVHGRSSGERMKLAWLIILIWTLGLLSEAYVNPCLIGWGLTVFL